MRIAPRRVQIDAQVAKYRGRKVRRRAAFHLRQLLAHKAGDSEKLKARLKRCEEKLK